MNSAFLLKSVALAVSAVLIGVSDIRAQGADCNAPVVDRQQLEIVGITGVVGNYDHAQTFTVGVTGWLAEIDVYAWGTGPATIEIRETTGGVPVEAESWLFSVELPQGSVPPCCGAVISIDVSSAEIFANAGDMLAIVARAEPPQDSSKPFMWRGTDLFIPGGQAFARDVLNQGTWIPVGANYYYVTRMCPATISIEPHSWGSTKAGYRH